jgi:hypothetical protein
MNTKARIVLVSALVLLGGVALVATGLAAPGSASLAGGGSPTVVAYQGEVQVSGAPYTGDGYFKFAVIKPASWPAQPLTTWSNDGTSLAGEQPTAAVQLAVSNGLFSVLLGDTTLGGMTEPLAADVFSEPDRYLRVWFSSDNSTFDQLAPDTQIAAVPYALQAERVRGYAGVVVVAKTGGDFTSVQAAVDSITDASAANPYLVWVAPGVYEEQVTMKPYVHLQGAGQEATIITSDASSSAWPPDQATLILASDVTLRDLTVSNNGAGDVNTALLATAGMTRTLAADVTARAVGGGVSNLGIGLTGSGTGVTLRHVTALAENGSSYGIGLTNHSGAAAVLHGGVFTGRGGGYTRGILATGTGTTLDATGVTALGEGGSDGNVGLFNNDGAAATLRGGSFAGRGGAAAWGINNSSDAATSTLAAHDVEALAEDGSGYNCGLDNHGYAAASLHGGSFTARGGGGPEGIKGIHNSGGGSTLHAVDVTALAENGSTYNYGLHNSDGASTTLRGGDFTGRGGTDGHGILNHTATLAAVGVTALSEASSSVNRGLLNENAAAATLRGGSFTGRGGANAYGLYNADGNTTLEATDVTAAAEDASTNNRGLLNDNSATATLRGGSFTGRGGDEAQGIYNDGSNTTLEATSATALAENGTSINKGLGNSSGAGAKLRGGSFTARGGTYAYGIHNTGTGTDLEANGVTALGEDGSSTNDGLTNAASATANVTQSVLEGTTRSVWRTAGTVTVSNSRLVGGAVAGAVTCVLVTRGTTISTDGSTCP